MGGIGRVEPATCTGDERLAPERAVLWRVGRQGEERVRKAFRGGAGAITTVEDLFFGGGEGEGGGEDWCVVRSGNELGGGWCVATCTQVEDMVVCFIYMLRKSEFGGHFRP